MRQMENLCVLQSHLVCSDFSIVVIFVCVFYGYMLELIIG